MSANTVAWGEKRAPIHRGEHLLTPGYGTDLELRIPATIEGPKRKEVSWGLTWLTDQRIIFIAMKRPGGDDLNMGEHEHRVPNLHSLIIPYETIKDNTYHLPIFSSNHELISFLPDPTHPKPDLPDPGADSALVAKLVVAGGMGNSLYKRIEKQRAAWLKRLRESETLPAYSATAPAPPVPYTANATDAPPPPAGSTGPVAVPDDAPPPPRADD